MFVKPFPILGNWATEIISKMKKTDGTMLNCLPASARAAGGQPQARRLGGCESDDRLSRVTVARLLIGQASLTAQASAAWPGPPAAGNMIFPLGGAGGPRPRSNASESPRSARVSPCDAWGSH